MFCYQQSLNRNISKTNKTKWLLVLYTLEIIFQLLWRQEQIQKINCFFSHCAVAFKVLCFWNIINIVDSMLMTVFCIVCSCFREVSKGLPTCLARLWMVLQAWLVELTFLQRLSCTRRNSVRTCLDLYQYTSVHCLQNIIVNSSVRWGWHSARYTPVNIRHHLIYLMILLTFQTNQILNIKSNFSMIWCLILSRKTFQYQQLEQLVFLNKEEKNRSHLSDL